MVNKNFNLKNLIKSICIPLKKRRQVLKKNDAPMLNALLTYTSIMTVTYSHQTYLVV
jgi:hypothetical protein